MTRSILALSAASFLVGPVSRPAPLRAAAARGQHDRCGFTHTLQWGPVARYAPARD